MKYDHKTKEAKWQQFWKREKTFKASVDRSKPKYYVLGTKLYEKVLACEINCQVSLDL